jgi:TetR/AcrR family transcriptional regulator, transcriptional repressor for nem operon
LNCKRNADPKISKRGVFNVPWPEEHKQKTRERILDAAALAFREQGIEQTSVADVMQRAGLTHGGFYAHFKSKEELVAEAIRHASEQVSKIFDSPVGKESAQRSLLEISAAYLSLPHMEHPERGCPIAALGTELLRSDRTVKRVVSRETLARLERLYQRTSPDAAPETRKRQAAGALACMVGGQILARALNGQEGAQFLADCQRFLRDALTGEVQTGSERIEK